MLALLRAEIQNPRKVHKCDAATAVYYIAVTAAKGCGSEQSHDLVARHTS